MPIWNTNINSRATEDLSSYQRECVAVTKDSIEGAIKWLWSLERTTSVSPTATCESLVKAINDSSVSNSVTIPNI